MKKTYFLLLILLIFLALRFYFYLNSSKIFKDGDSIRITSKVSSEPIRYETSQYLRLQGLKIYLPLYPEISYGDTVIIEGTVLDGKLSNPKLVGVEMSENFIYVFRKSLLDFYRKSLPEPHSSLVAGVTIGSKAGIPQDFWDKLKSTGTAHVVVASGMNVTLVSGFLVNFLILFFKRKKALILALAGVWIYALMSGFDAPIIRAAIMGSIAFSAQEMGRLNYSLRALSLSAFLMLFISPQWTSDLGFWLSFFATLSIILFEPRIRKRLKVVPLVLRQNFSTTLAAQIGVAPILYYSFGQFNILSPFINVMILWTIVPITLAGMIGGLIGLIIPIVGRGILFLSYPLTWWFMSVLETFG